MRTVVVLFALTILLPILVCLPVGTANAAALVNINTADATLLDTLPGIGPSKATAIVDYRIQNGLFATIGDIQNVSGIGPTTFANIKDLITVGDTSITDTPADQTASSTDTATQNTSSSSGSAMVSTPSLSALTVDAGPNQDAVVEVPFRFSARATTRSGVVDSSAHISWGFGDGSSAEAGSVLKTYHYAGTYLVVVTATDGSVTGQDELVVTVRPARVTILEIPGTGIMVTNDASERLDISNWILTADTHSFHIPSGTVVLPKTNIVIPSSITNLPTASNVTLAYPDGIVAARYNEQTQSVAVTPALSVDRQPSMPQTSFNTVQKVEPIISTKTNLQVHENAVSAPSAVSATETAEGAALPASPPLAVASPAGNLFKSPWTIGFLGTIILAGGAFILL